ncbi:hypothetical protein LEP1GSC080_0015 [Leptospira interrogans str. FPW2026]|nr:hypothetical protein LEP1GSC080_0015 [Leptospira interrogans str. FPW2026]
MQAEEVYIVLSKILVLGQDIIASLINSYSLLGFSITQ